MKNIIIKALSEMRRGFRTGILLVFAGLMMIGAGAPVYAQQKNRKDATREKGAVAVPPSGNIALLIDAKKEALLGNNKEALRLFQSYVEKYPEDPAGHYELARLEANDNKYDQAISHLLIAREKDPDNLWYQLFLAELYQLTANYKKSVEIYEKVVALHPEEPDYLFQLASLYLASGKFEEAVKAYDQIEQIVGISEDLIIQKQKIYMHLKQPQKAEQELRRLIEAFPGESRYYSILAEYYMNNNQPEKALKIYQEIAGIDPGNAYIHMSLADYYRKTGNREKSYEELKLGFANPNLDIDTKVTILLSFYSINQLYSELKDEAFELTRILTATHPGDPKAYSILGDLLAQDKRYQEARTAFLNVIAIDSGKYVIWEEILRLSLLLEDYKGLIGYAVRAIAIYPEQPVLYLFKGLSELQLKQTETSLETLQIGIKLVVDNPELEAQYHMYLGDAWHAKGDNELSDLNYDKALHLKPDNAYVLNNYAYYLSLRGVQLDKAEKMARKAVNLEPENSSFQDTYGWVLYRLGNYDMAREWIEKALKDEKNASGEVLEHFGDVCYRLGETDKAMEYWNKAKLKGGGSDLLLRKIQEKRLIE